MAFKEDAEGLLIGTLVGDSLGLPYEGLSPERTKRFLNSSLKHRFIFGRGMMSDDTEHSCMVMQALIDSPENDKLFSKRLAFSLRFWLLGLPSGIGFATLRSIIKLWVGFAPDKSGVFSAGNGAVMRSAPIGLFYADDYNRMKRYIHANTIITHSDPKAEYGAFVIALIASTANNEIVNGVSLMNLLRAECPEDANELLTLLENVVKSVDNGESLEQYLMGCNQVKGVSGYTYHTVPAVVHCWLRHCDDFEKGISEIIEVGGDTDTTAAILGALIGIRVGVKGIRKDWIEGVWDFPRSVSWMVRLTSRLAEVKEDGRQNPVFLNLPILFARNIFFMMIVLFHGFRRLLPPY